MSVASLLFLFLLVICGFGILLVESLLATVVLFGAFSFFSAAWFVTQGALDVAFTEAAVGAVITTVYYMLTLFETQNEEAGK